MPRAQLTLVALFALGCGAVLGYSFATRPSAERAQTSIDPPAASLPISAAQAANPDEVTEPVAQPAQADTQPPSPQPVPPNAVAQLQADAMGNDPAKRTAAIEALAKAPRSQALPVLHRVLSAGETDADRRLALASLRTLAQNEGDADEGIRRAIRDAIYHGDNESVTSEAQAVLGDVENDLAATRPNTPR
jgi:hypothetical protein